MNTYECHLHRNTFILIKLIITSNAACNMHSNLKMKPQDQDHDNTMMDNFSAPHLYCQCVHFIIHDEDKTRKVHYPHYYHSKEHSAHSFLIINLPTAHCQYHEAWMSWDYDFPAVSCQWQLQLDKGLPPMNDN